MLVIGGIVAVVVVALGGLAWRSSSGLEEPAYTVVERAKDYEIREYPPYLVAETIVTGDQRSAGREAFRRLAGYIFGKNTKAQKMAMTAPVTSEEGGSEKMAMTTPVTSEKMAMTAPVTSESAEDGKYRYQFVMESKYTLQSLPKPDDSRVTLKEVPGQRVAVRRFSGSWSEEHFLSEVADLREALARDGLQAQGNFRSARYNAPFTPGFLRRNEVMFTLAPSK
ncbi:MAG: heme-binding protein [Polyangiaceae bacterium]|nr:heme-binding protein [Polyangiaceae bacterium]